MVCFTDKFSRTFDIVITSDGADRVRSLVQTPTGVPVDIFACAETGKFDALKNLETLSKVVFVLCMSDFLSDFCEDDYDEANADLYEMLPERKLERRAQKAFRDFSRGLTGDVIEKMTEALMQAVVNFTPSQARKSAIQTVVAKEREIDDLICEELLERLTERANTFKAGLKEQVGTALHALDVLEN